MKSPTAVRRSVTAFCFGAAVDVGYPGMAWVDGGQNIFLDHGPGAIGVGERISREFMQITGADQVFKGLRRGVLVLSELIDGMANCVELLFQLSFFSSVRRNAFNAPAASQRQH